MRFETEEDESRFVSEMASVFKVRFGTPMLPAPDESIALSVVRPKTAALAHDKVYRIPVLDDPVPEDLAFYGASPGEIAHAAVALWTLGLLPEVGIELPLEEPASPSQKTGRDNLRDLAVEIAAGVGREPTIIYADPRDQREDFPAGPHEVLRIAIEGLELVDEERLSWEQVREFRRDRQARLSYRRLLRWLDARLEAQEPAALIGELEDRLEDYRWAIRKHGLATAMGVGCAIFNPKFLGALSAGTAAAAIAGGSTWAAVAAASIPIGQAVFTFGSSYLDGLDERRKANREVAYLYQIGRQL